jgi:uncharacterized protein YbcI
MHAATPTRCFACQSRGQFYPVGPGIQTIRNEARLVVRERPSGRSFCSFLLSGTGYEEQCKGSLVSDQATPASNGQRALAISNAITRLHREHYGRGATTARTIMQRNYVVTFLDDIYTPVERTLIEAGEREPVFQTRLAFQRAMEGRFVAAVEEVTKRKVIAFLSQVHFDPDISAEIFVLEPNASDGASEG